SLRETEEKVESDTIVKMEPIDADYDILNGVDCSSDVKEELVDDYEDDKLAVRLMIDGNQTAVFNFLLTFSNTMAEGNSAEDPY
ncbi:hypothetical protein PENTCL1PPCAC_26067, partial [Pristionchus entomophagus]